MDTLYNTLERESILWINTGATLASDGGESVVVQSIIPCDNGQCASQNAFYYDNCNLNGTFALQLDNKLHNLMSKQERNMISFHKICDNFCLLCPY